eukprot:Gb_03871 [translate_table: standard]
MYKSKLQEYAQKISLQMPVYETTKEGPSHMPRFRATVTVNGAKYSSPQDFGSRKAAEFAAAQVAFEDLAKKAPFPSPIETAISKSLLQEFAQKMHLPLPNYRSIKAGVTHCPTFSCTVEIGGISYTGGAAKSKKEAEGKAAQKALLAMKSQAYQLDSVSVNPGSQLQIHSGSKRERGDFEEPIEERKVIKSEPKETAVDSSSKDEPLVQSSIPGPTEKDLDKSIVKDACAAPAGEPQKQAQESYSVVQQGQLKEEGDSSQEKVHGSKEVEENQQGAHEIACAEAMNKTHKMEAESIHNAHEKKKKNKRKKKIHVQ